MIKDMITEDYCNFEISKLLKEKGFEQHKCQHSYNSKGVFKWSDDLDPYECSAPTLQMAMKWLREIFHIHIRLIHSSDESYTFEIYPMSGKYRCKCFENYTYYSSYEEAVEAALKYALTNLI